MPREDSSIDGRGTDQLSMWPKSQINSVPFLDALPPEQSSAQSRLTFAINSKGNVCNINQYGEGEVEFDRLEGMIDVNLASPLQMFPTTSALELTGDDCFPCAASGLVGRGNAENVGLAGRKYKGCNAMTHNETRSILKPNEKSWRLF